MATVLDLVASLANRLHEPVASVRQKVRNLQDNGLLPVASGRAVPSIEPQHVALAILAVLGADAVKDATRVAQRLSALTEGGSAPIACPPDFDEEVNGPARHTLLSFLTNVFGKLLEADGTPAIIRFGHANASYELCLSWPEFRASIPVFEEGCTGDQNGTLAIQFGEPGQATTHWRGYVRKAVAVAGMAISGIAFDLADASAAADAPSARLKD